MMVVVPSMSMFVVVFTSVMLLVVMAVAMMTVFVTVTIATFSVFYSFTLRIAAFNRDLANVINVRNVGNFDIAGVHFYFGDDVNTFRLSIPLMM
jgi:hypothetical protein